MAAIPCRLRKYRKSLHLSQREMAFLVGLRSQGHVAEIESGRKHPGLTAAVACSMVFGVPLGELFPELQTRIAEDVLRSVRTLQSSLALGKRRSAASASLAALTGRLDGSPLAV